MKLLKVDTTDQVKGKIHRYFRDLELHVESVDLTHGRGRVLAEDVVAPFHVPEFNRSTVDGYALISRDTFGVSDSLPVFLEVLGSVEMGKVADLEVTSGKAVYIPTGGMIPQGADAVIMVEYIEKLDEGTIAVYRSVAPGEGMIHKGEDIKKGEVLLSRGTTLGAHDLGALAAMGYQRVKVFVRPRVTIISTGDEIVAPREEIQMGQIRDINTYALGAMVESMGGQVVERLLLRDDYDVLRDHLSKVSKDSDMVLISGGSSVGLKDMTAKVIDSLGSPGVFVHGVAIKPGKPTIIGRINDTAVFGLPGHPVSALIVCRLFVGHLMELLLSQQPNQDLQVDAITQENIHSAPGKETYQMVELFPEGDRMLAQPVYGKSGAISTLTRAHGYIKIETNREGINKGDRVRVTLL